MYSQNQEEQHILNYFGSKVGTFLDIGANDGITLSNTRALVELGWGGVLVEPSPEAFKRLIHNSINYDVLKINVAVTMETGFIKLYESGEHLGVGDVSLVSSTVMKETLRWKNETFNEVKVKSVTVEELLLMSRIKTFDFITIDAEGVDFEILSKLDLNQLQCSMICVEHNNIETKKYIDYIAQFGMKLIYQNNENILMAL